MKNIFFANDKNIKKISKELQQGKIIIFPTDTVYGIGCNSYLEPSVLNLFQLKKRNLTNPLTVLFSSIKEIEKHMVINNIFYKIIENLTTNGLTLILEKQQRCPISPFVSNHSKYLGVRIPNCKITLDLIKEAKVPICAPSANISGGLSPTTAKEAYFNFLDNDVLTLDGGNSPIGIESTLLDISNPNKIILLREGAVSKDILKKTLEPTYPIFDTPHYISKYQINKSFSLEYKKIKENDALLAFGKIDITLPNNIVVLNLSENADLQEAAKNFFTMLNKLKSSASSNIYIMPIPNIGIGKSINQRILKLIK